MRSLCAAVGLMVLVLGACSPGEAVLSESRVALTGQAIRSRSNSLVRLPYGNYLADIDGDGLAELISVTGNKLFVNRVDSAGTGVGHHYFDQNVRELAFGRFTLGVDRQELCAALEDGSIECIRWISAEQRFKTWLSHGSHFNGSPQIAAPSTTDRMIVGDFDGNGVEDLMLHDPATGATQFLVAQDLGCSGNGFCGYYFLGSQANYPVIAGFDLRNKDIYAGEFGTCLQCTDLLIVDRSNGKAYRFDSSPGDPSRPPLFTTFSSVGPTASGEISSSEVLALANVDANGINSDALVTYNPAAGTTRILRVTPGLHFQIIPGLPSPLVGSAPAGSRLIFAKVVNRNEPGSTVREDFVAYDAGQQLYLTFDARFISGANTYQFDFLTHIRRFDQEFLPLQPPSPWLILMCRDNDVPAGPGYAVDPFKWYYAKEGREIPGFYNYIKDMSYGQYNYKPTVQGVTTIPFGQGVLTRDTLWNTCVQQAGVTASQYQHVLVTTNGVDNFGQGAAAQVVTLDGRSNPWAPEVPHELGHNMGLNHAYTTSSAGCGGSPDPGEYCDTLDPMGMDSVYLWDASAYPIAGPTPINIFVRVAAGYGGFNRLQLGWIPSARQQTIQFGAGMRNSVDLAALDRPESTGTLAAIVHVQTTADPNDFYVIDFRTASGRWDKALASDGVSARRVKFDTADPSKGYRAYLAVSAARPDGLFHVGDSIPLDGPYEGGTAVVLTVRVVSIDAANGHAQVMLTTN